MGTKSRSLLSFADLDATHITQSPVQVLLLQKWSHAVLNEQ
jgi:hypothetical protein